MLVDWPEWERTEWTRDNSGNCITGGAMARRLCRGEGNIIDHEMAEKIIRDSPVGHVITIWNVQWTRVK